MSTQAWIGIGTAAFAGGIFLLAIWRGFKVSRVSLFGTLELELPKPIEVQRQGGAAIPALVLLVVGVLAIGFGSYRNWFPPKQLVTITKTPKLNYSTPNESPSSFGSTGVTFLNKTSEPLELYWIDFSGKAQHWTSIPPGSFADVATYVGHIWVARTPTGIELLRYVAEESP